MQNISWFYISKFNTLIFVSQALEKLIDEQLARWNVGGLLVGMYFYRIQAGEMIGSGKVVKKEIK